MSGLGEPESLQPSSTVYMYMYFNYICHICPWTWVKHCIKQDCYLNIDNKRALVASEFGSVRGAKVGRKGQ